MLLQFHSISSQQCWWITQVYIVCQCFSNKLSKRWAKIEVKLNWQFTNKAYNVVNVSFIWLDKQKYAQCKIIKISNIYSSMTSSWIYIEKYSVPIGTDSTIHGVDKWRKTIPWKNFVECFVKWSYNCIAAIFHLTSRKFYKDLAFMHTTRIFMNKIENSITHLEKKEFSEKRKWHNLRRIFKYTHFWLNIMKNGFEN